MTISSASHRYAMMATVLLAITCNKVAIGIPSSLANNSNNANAGNMNTQESGGNFFFGNNGFFVNNFANPFNNGESNNGSNEGDSEPVGEFFSD